MTFFCLDAEADRNDANASEYREDPTDLVSCRAKDSANPTQPDQ